jgi:hypothetical protein
MNGGSGTGNHAERQLVSFQQMILSDAGEF